MKIVKYPEKSSWKELLKRPEIDQSGLEVSVRSVLQDVKINGNKAVIEYTFKFDKVKLSSFQVSKEEIEEAANSISFELKKAISLAKNNIEKFHKSQITKSNEVETATGVKCWQKSVPVEKVGLYIPGGTAPLFSTVLMLGIPAVIAGCREIVLCSPPGKDGKIPASILYTADFIGIQKIFKIGGIQAIAAMTFGTETVPRVYKIFGPGNQYIMAAKQIVSTMGVAIDMPAGPSEVAVIADETSIPSYVASDLLAQAEHGRDSQVILFTTDEKIVEPVELELKRQLDELPRNSIASASLNNSKVIIMKNDDELMGIVNEYAPEHLIIQVDKYKKLASKVINAGSVFLGHYTPESAGDYASGTNHTLPTKGYAKSFNGVNMDSFFKKITFQQISEEGIKNIGPAIEIMALNEDLFGHKNSVTVRLNKIAKTNKDEKLR